MARRPLTNEEAAITANEHHDSGNYVKLSGQVAAVGAAALIAGGGVSYLSSGMNEDAMERKLIDKMATATAGAGGLAAVGGLAAQQVFRRRRQVANDSLLRADVQLPMGPNTGFNDYILQDGTRLHPPTEHSSNWAITLSEERSKQLNADKESKR